MALEGDGTVGTVRGTNLRFYIENAVSTDPRTPFVPDDPFAVEVVPHTALVLTPQSTDHAQAHTHAQSKSLTLDGLLRALGFDPERITAPDIDPCKIQL